MKREAQATVIPDCCREPHVRRQQLTAEFDISGYQFYQAVENGLVPAETIPAGGQRAGKVYKPHQALRLVIALDLKRFGFGANEIYRLVDDDFIEAVMAGRIKYVVGVKASRALRAENCATLGEAETWEAKLKAANLSYTTINAAGIYKAIRTLAQRNMHNPGGEGGWTGAAAE